MNRKVNRSFNAWDSADKPKSIDLCEVQPSGNLLYLRIIPLKTTSEANSREHWHKKAQRHSMQKMTVKSFMNVDSPQITPPCIIKLTRIAPRKLDRHENLPMSFKYIVDQICSYIHPDLAPGRADDDENIHIQYAQEKGAPKEYAIRIEITKTEI